MDFLEFPHIQLNLTPLEQQFWLVFTFLWLGFKVFMSTKKMLKFAQFNGFLPNSRFKLRKALYNHLNCVEECPDVIFPKFGATKIVHLTLK